MESEPVKRSLPIESQPDSDGAVQGVSSELKDVIAGLWQAVKHGADVIVTLRQENTMLQSQLASLKHSEAGMQERIDELLSRIEALGASSPKDEGPLLPFPIDRLEDTVWETRIQELEASLDEAVKARAESSAQLMLVEQSLAGAKQQLEEQRHVSEQVLQLRSELESRAQLLQELQGEFADREAGPSAAYTIQLETENVRLAAELETASAIVQRYRDAGLRHLENRETEDQLGLFLQDSAQIMAEPSLNLVELAGRLEAIAQQLDELAELS